MVATLTRLVMACAIMIASDVSLANGRSIVHINNGLGRPVTVSIGDDSLRLAAFSRTKLAVGNRGKYSVRAATDGGEVIERFDVNIAAGSSTSVYNIASASALVERIGMYGGVEELPPPRLLGMDRWLNSSADYIFAEPPIIAMGKEGSKHTELSAEGHQSPWIMAVVVETDEQFRAVARVHAIYDLGDKQRVRDWIDAAARAPRFDEVLHARLLLQPKDVVTLRAEQDYAVGSANRANVCDRHQALAKREPRNVDLQYVAARCLREPSRKDQAHLDLYAREPGHGWAAFGAAMTLLEQGRWQEALRPLTTALWNVPSARSQAAEDLLRVHRQISDDGDVPAGALAECSPRLMRQQAIEADRDKVDDGYAHYHYLWRGEPTRAAKQALSYTDRRGFRLAAASEGVDREIIRQALALPPEEGMSNAVRPFAYALALREGAAEVAAIHARQIIGTRAEQTDQPIFDFISALHRGSSHAEADQLLKGVHHLIRAQAYAAAIVLQGDRAPPEWRRIALRMLFAQERPYFTSPPRHGNPGRIANSNQPANGDSYRDACHWILPARGYGFIGGD